MSDLSALKAAAAALADIGAEVRACTAGLTRSAELTAIRRARADQADQVLFACRAGHATQLETNRAVKEKHARLIDLSCGCQHDEWIWAFTKVCPQHLTPHPGFLSIPTGIDVTCGGKFSAD